MTAITQIAGIVLSWPACLLWLALMFRQEIGEALRRLRLVKITGYFEGQLDEPRRRRTRKPKSPGCPPLPCPDRRGPDRVNLAAYLHPSARSSPQGLPDPAGHPRQS